MGVRGQHLLSLPKRVSGVPFETNLSHNSQNTPIHTIACIAIYASMFPICNKCYAWIWYLFICVTNFLIVNVSGLFSWTNIFFNAFLTDIKASLHYFFIFSNNFLLPPVVIFRVFLFIVSITFSPFLFVCFFLAWFPCYLLYYKHHIW
jgi:hypothetical protein